MIHAWSSSACALAATIIKNITPTSNRKSINNSKAAEMRLLHYWASALLKVSLHWRKVANNQRPGASVVAGESERAKLVPLDSA
jgi:hypothetical protein